MRAGASWPLARPGCPTCATGAAHPWQVPASLPSRARAAPLPAARRGHQATAATPRPRARSRCTRARARAHAAPCSPRRDAVPFRAVCLDGETPSRPGACLAPHSVSAQLSSRGPCETSPTWPGGKFVSGTLNLSPPPFPPSTHITTAASRRRRSSSMSSVVSVRRLWPRPDPGCPYGYVCVVPDRGVRSDH